MRSFAKGIDPSQQPEPAKRAGLGKLVVFAAAEAGVGRSVCAANVAAILAQRSRCLALDLDVHSRNLQAHLGMMPVARGIAEFLDDRSAPLESIQSRTLVGNLQCAGWSTSAAKPVGLGTLKINALLQSLQTHPADRVLATLPAGATDDTLELFAAADVPLLVLLPTTTGLSKAFEFLGRCASNGFGNRPVHIIVNQVQRGGEEKEAAAFVEKAKQSLGMNVVIMGSILYDRDFESSCQQGKAIFAKNTQRATALALDDIALKIERLLPAARREPLAATLVDPAAKKSRRLMWFGRKSRDLEIQLQQKDEALRRFRQQQEEKMGQLQQIVEERNAQIAERDGVIEKLEEDFRIQTDDLADKFKRIETLEASIFTVRKEFDQRYEQITQLRNELKETAARLAGSEARIREQDGIIADKAVTISDLQDQLARATNDQRLLADRTTEALSQIANEIRSEREKIQSEAYEQRRILQQKASDIQGVADRLLQVTAQNGTAAAEVAQAIADLTQVIQVHRDDTVRGLTQLTERQESASKQSAGTSERLGTEIHGLTQRLTELADRQAAAANGTTEALRKLSGEVAKGDEIAVLANRLTQLGFEHSAAANQSGQTLQQLAVEMREHRDETLRALTNAQGTTAHNLTEIRQSLEESFLHGKEKEMAALSNGLGELQQAVRERDVLIENSVNQMSGNIAAQRDEIVRVLAETEKRVQERDALLAEKKQEIRTQREESMVNIETYRTFAAAIDDRTRALVAEMEDTSRRKDETAKQLQETLRQQVSQLQELQLEKEIAIGRLERGLRAVENDNYRLKADLMGTITRKPPAPGPELLGVQRTALAEALRLHPPQSITLVATPDAEKESPDFVLELQSTFESCGWIVSRHLPSTFDKSEIFGLHVVTDGSAEASSTARILSDAFGKARLRLIERTDPSPDNLDAVRLIVGISNS